MKLKKIIRGSFTSIILITILSSISCMKKTPEEAEDPLQQRIENCRQELHKKQIRPVIKISDKTLWIYTPLDNDLFIIRNNPFAKNLARDYIYGISGSYDEEKRDIIFKYYYDKLLNKFKPLSYFENANFDFSEEAKNISTKINYALLDKLMFEDIQNYITFLVLVMADVKNAVEYYQVFYIQDLKKMALGLLPSFEARERVYSYVKGNPEIKDDYYGRHLKVYNISLEEFIVNQIISRAYKNLEKVLQNENLDDPYNQINNALLTNTREVCKFYNFSNFNHLEILNIMTGSKSIYLPVEILD